MDPSAILKRHSLSDEAEVLSQCAHLFYDVIYVNL